MKTFYLIAAVVGTVVPWYFFSDFFIVQGSGLSQFLAVASANTGVAGISADISLSLLVFWVWAVVDARRNQVKAWWVIFPTAALVGLSLALPLYLYLREDSTTA